MEVKVIADECTACGICEDICPEVFEMGDEDVAVVKVNPVPEEHQEAVREAAEECASEAIEISE